MARKDVLAVVRGAGFAASFWIALDKAARKRGLNDEQIYDLLNGENSPLVDKMADLMAESVRPKFPTYTITVNYDRSVADGITAGKYDWVNNDIAQEHFPTKRTGTSGVEVQLVHFGREMAFDEVIRELDKLGLRPAELPELLALGEKHPDLQRDFPIVALGSRGWGSFGGWSVAFLSRDDVGRFLGLGWVGGSWNGVHRFAAVSK